MKIASMSLLTTVAAAVIGFAAPAPAHACGGDEPRTVERQVARAAWKQLAAEQRMKAHPERDRILSITVTGDRARVLLLRAWPLDESELTVHVAELTLVRRDNIWAATGASEQITYMWPMSPQEFYAWDPPRWLL